jgi:tRNA-dihydrouridine synthase B
MLPSLAIGDLKLQTPLLLAPLAGYCDLSFRKIARKCGSVGLAFTDLLCPHAILRETKQTLTLAATDSDDSPIGFQLFGDDPDLLCQACLWAKEHGAEVVDLNMGCPVDRITKENHGAALLKCPDASLKLIEAMVKILAPTPMTCKIRLGWDWEHIVAPYLVKRMADVGVKAVTVHGRTAKMGFSGAASLDHIAEAVAATTIPVIGNGDVRTPQDAKRMFEKTRCAGVMIGRAALSTPWIFRDAWSYLETGVIAPKPTIHEICGMMREHFYEYQRLRNTRAAISEFRKRISWYAKELNPCPALRQEMRFIQTAADFEACLGRFLEWREKNRLCDQM